MSVSITVPGNGEALDIEGIITFSGTADAGAVAVNLVADDQFDLGTVEVDSGGWTMEHRFSRPGLRHIRAQGLDNNGDAISDDAIDIILRTDPTTCAFRQTLFLVGGQKVFHLPADTTFFFAAGMSVDADGSPHAYNPSNTGLDHINNAKDKNGHFVGVVTDGNGDPVVQGAGDPAPGFFVSPTSLEDTTHPVRSPLRYVNAETVPFIALPPKARDSGGAALGDFVAVYNSQTDELCFGIFADIGPSSHLGEGSIALAKALGIPSNPRTGGVSKGILYVVFPGSRKAFGTKWTHTETQATIDSEAGKLFEIWGGKQRVEACFLEIT